MSDRDTNHCPGHGTLLAAGPASSSYMVLGTDTTIHVPRDVAICPYCEASLVLQVTGWGQLDDGTWAASLIDLDCVSEPDMPEDDDDPRIEEWEGWMEGHSYMPYLHWLPVEDRVLYWLNRLFRWRLPDRNGGADGND